jgi:hypothetical protein
MRIPLTCAAIILTLAIWLRRHRVLLAPSAGWLPADAPLGKVLD